MTIPFKKEWQQKKFECSGCRMKIVQNDLNIDSYAFFKERTNYLNVSHGKNRFPRSSFLMLGQIFWIFPPSAVTTCRPQSEPSLNSIGGWKTSFSRQGCKKFFFYHTIIILIHLALRKKAFEIFDIIFLLFENLQNTKNVYINV